jgi:hypothetical protein
MLKDRIVEFTVAMDKEAKENGDVKKVKFTLTFPESCEDQLQTDAIAHQVVKWQSQIRSNWDKFLENGVPETITYGSPLYGSRRGAVRPPTEAEMADYAAKRIASLTPEQLQEFIKTGRFPE